MTGYKSKKAAALDEEGMYLVHHTKRKVDDDDDTQVYQRGWVRLTDEEISDIAINNPPMVHEFARAIEAKLREKNT
jgi:hypothetical protein